MRIGIRVVQLLDDVPAQWITITHGGCFPGYKARWIIHRPGITHTARCVVDTLWIDVRELIITQGIGFGCDQ